LKIDGKRPKLAAIATCVITGQQGNDATHM